MGKMTRRLRSAGHSFLSRRVMSAVCLFGSVEGVKMLCMLVRNKMAAYLIGTAGFGLLGILSNTINLLSTLCEMSLLTVGVREIASSSEEERPGTIAFILRYGRWLAAVGMAVTLALAPILSYCIFDSMAYAATFMVISIAVACNILASSHRAVLQGEGRLGAIARAVTWSTVIGLALAVAFLWLFHEDGVMPMLVSYSVVLFLSVLFFNNKKQLPAVSLSEVKSRATAAVRLGFFITLSGVGSWLSTLVLMIWINHVGSTTVVGLYEVGQTLTVRYVGVVFAALSIEFFPRLSAAFSAGRLRARVMMRHEAALSVVVVTALCSLLIPQAPLIVEMLYNRTFLDVVPMVVWACPGIILRAASWSMAYLLVADGRGKIYLATEVTSAVLCVLIMGSGYKLFGMVGLGIGFSLWYLGYTLIIWTVLRSIYRLGLGLKVWVLCFSAVAAIALVAVSSVFFEPVVTATLAALVFITAAVILFRQVIS